LRYGNDAVVPAPKVEFKHPYVQEIQTPALFTVHPGLQTVHEVADVGVP